MAASTQTRDEILSEIVLRDIHTEAVNPDFLLSREEQIEARQTFENETGFTQTLATQALVRHMRAVQQFGTQPA